MRWLRSSLRQASTIVYIPPAHRPVRSFRFYRFIAIVVIMALIVSILAIYMAQYNETLDAKTRIDWLNAQIEREREQHRTMLAMKDTMIEDLQLNVYDLSQAAEQIKAQMDDLKLLEQEIRELSGENDLPLDELGVDSTVPNHVGGAFRQPDEVVIQQWTSGTKQNFVALENELQHLTELLSEAKTSLEEIDAIRRQTPSIWPTKSTTITSSYGIRKDPFTQRLTLHNGVDISGDINDLIHATADGVVEETGKDHVRGNYIILAHRHGLQTVYMHLNKINVSVDDPVNKGDPIGTMGSTGRSTGVHLHYEVHKDNQAVNPRMYMNNPIE